jgi:hypothetical protein
MLHPWRDRARGGGRVSSLRSAIAESSHPVPTAIITPRIPFDPRALDCRQAGTVKARSAIACARTESKRGHAVPLSPTFGAEPKFGPVGRLAARKAAG